jgi:hypothetical protein
VFDAVGNFYVAGGGYLDSSDLGPIWEYSSSDNLLNTLNVVGDDGAPGYLDVAADQHTLYYTASGTDVERYDVIAKSQLSILTADLTAANIYDGADVRILTDGSVLVGGGSESVVRFDTSGTLLQIYAATNGSRDFEVLALDPGGASF